MWDPPEEVVAIAPNARFRSRHGFSRAAVTFPGGWVVLDSDLAASVFGPAVAAHEAAHVANRDWVSAAVHIASRCAVIAAAAFALSWQVLPTPLVLVAVAVSMCVLELVDARKRRAAELRADAVASAAVGPELFAKLLFWMASPDPFTATDHRLRTHPHVLTRLAAVGVHHLVLSPPSLFLSTSVSGPSSHPQ